MSDRRRNTGQRGEQIAADHLRRKGYGIIAANWRCPRGEIDLIADDHGTLVIVEVRTRRSAIAGLAAESVTIAKQRRLINLAYAYLDQLDEMQTPWRGPWRIDVVAIQISGGTSQVHHLEYAVEDC